MNEAPRRRGRKAGRPSWPRRVEGTRRLKLACHPGLPWSAHGREQAAAYAKLASISLRTSTRAPGAHVCRPDPRRSAVRAARQPRRLTLSSQRPWRSRARVAARDPLRAQGARSARLLRTRRVTRPRSRSRARTACPAARAANLGGRLGKEVVIGVNYFAGAK
jgi:hypothetical protein